MKTGIIMISIAWIIFIILSGICLFTNHKKEWLEFELDDILDLHVEKWFWNPKAQFMFRMALMVSFILFAIGILIFSLNCFPEWGATWDKVCLRVFAAFFGFMIVGRILSILGNIIAFAIPFTGMVAMYLVVRPIEWALEGMRDRE